MKIDASAFSMSKIGNSDEDYADAYYIPRPHNNNHFSGSGEKFLFAIADGATEAAFPGIWAKLLVNSYGNGYLRWDNFEDNIPNLQLIWEKVVNKMDLPWYGKEKVKQGSASTFLGIKFTENKIDCKDYGIYEIISIGDSCTFQVRNDSLIKYYPVKASNLFNSNPNLVYTLPSLNMGLGDLIEMRTRIWHRGDTFYLMTDSLSHWFLKEVEEGNTPWITLNSIDRESSRLDFSEFVSNLIGINHMRNDDATLIRIEIK